MLSNEERVGFCVTSEQAAVAQLPGKSNIHGKHNDEELGFVYDVHAGKCFSFTECFSANTYTVKALI